MAGGVPRRRRYGRGRICREGTRRGVHIPDAEEGVADVNPHRGDIPQRGGVQGTSRDAALPQIQGGHAAHDQVTQARAHATARSRSRGQHLQEVDAEMMILTMMGYPVGALPILTIIATIIDPPATMLNVTGDTVSSITGKYGTSITAAKQ